MDGDVQRLGCQKPQLSFVSILHTCRRVEERVSPPSTLVCCAVRTTGPLLVTQLAGPFPKDPRPHRPWNGVTWPDALRDRLV